MKKAVHHTFFLISTILIATAQTSGDTSRLLILDFDCSGKAAGQSSSIGRAFRGDVQKQGGLLVSRDLFEKLIKQKGLDESDLNYTIDKLKSLLPALGADGAVYGHVFTSEDIFTMEIRYLGSDGGAPILFDPVICGSLDDIYAVLPEMAAVILSPDKNPPSVVSVEPADGRTDVGQYVEMKIIFSEPMNPSTISVSAMPENMWGRYGDIIYQHQSNSFIVKFHLYPEIEYKFQINGDNSKGFKDLAGNPARKFTWSFKTAR